MKVVSSVLLFVVSLSFSALALTAPFGYGWFHVPADFRLPLLGFFANLMLLVVTWAYVLITRDQLKELQSAREPRAILNVRVPQFGLDEVKYGRGNHEYRSGSPIFLDVWNVSGPSIMVSRVQVRVNESVQSETLNPQILVESGKVGSISVGYQILGFLSESKSGLCDLPADRTTAKAHLTADYFSLAGTRTVHTECKLSFFTTEEHIAIQIDQR
jgi:hypothetical protein